MNPPRWVRALAETRTRFSGLRNRRVTSYASRADAWLWSHRESNPDYSDANRTCSRYHYGPKLSRWRDSNPLPRPYQGRVQPGELHRQMLPLVVGYSPAGTTPRDTVARVSGLSSFVSRNLCWARCVLHRGALHTHGSIARESNPPRPAWKAGAFAARPAMQNGSGSSWGMPAPAFALSREERGASARWLSPRGCLAIRWSSSILMRREAFDYRTTGTARVAARRSSSCFWMASFSSKESLPLTKR
jgi:hypothetical protein